jgi:hypothetical protein
MSAVLIDVRCDVVVSLPSQRELRRQPRETEVQILNRRGTLITLGAAQDGDRFCFFAAMAYMTDL